MRREPNKLRSGKSRRFVDPAFKDKIRRRDNYECRICFAKASEFKYALQVHHIRPVSIGGRDRENNLITLCENCHLEVHEDIYAWIQPLRNYIDLYKRTGQRYSVCKEG
tara:strand:+ start:2049 stop:2375 length:327 start_codon:yes stop_codon:yes gene_type:complete